MNKNQNSQDLTYAQVIEAAQLMVDVYGGSPLPPRFRSNREIFRAPNQFQKLETGDLTVAVPVSYNCRKLGSILGVLLGSVAHFRVADIARISGLTSLQIESFLKPCHFATTRFSGAAEAFVDWDAAALFCVMTKSGKLLIPWVAQIILPDLHDLQKRSFSN
jgi:hypothetical protein